MRYINQILFLLLLLLLSLLLSDVFVVVIIIVIILLLFFQLYPTINVIKGNKTASHKVPQIYRKKIEEKTHNFKKLAKMTSSVDVICCTMKTN